MDRKTGKKPYKGEEYEGRKWKKILQDNGQSALEQLVAIGQILYLVRSNLAHGSKTESGDDREIIEMSIEPLRVFLAEAILYSFKSFGPQK